MQLGKALVGAVIGAAVGIGILIAAYLGLQQQSMWLAIVVALATGLGVRMMVATKGHASIVRGAMTLVLALVAYLAGWWLVAEIASRRPMGDATQLAAGRAAESDEEGEAGDADEEPAAAPAPLLPEPTGPRIDGAAQRRGAAPGGNPLEFVWLAIAALVAYELGRGTGMAAPGVAASDEASMPDPALSRGENPPSTAPGVVRPPD